MMKDYFYKETEVILPKDYEAVFNQFYSYFGDVESAISQLEYYLGYSWLSKYSEALSFGGVPFELLLSFETGSNGEILGWVDLAPEDPNFIKPFVNFAPLGTGLYYLGINATEVCQNLVRYYHEANNYDGIDLEFLASINVYPKMGEVEQHTHHDICNQLEKIITVKPYQIFQASVDGTAVLADSKWFANDYLYQPLSPKDAISLAKNYAKNNHWATALLCLKDMYSQYFCEEGDFHKDTLNLMKEAYQKVGKESLSNNVERSLKAWN